MDRIGCGRRRDDDATREEADDDRRHHGERRQREHAAREMLEDFALGTVMIVRMRRAAGDRRSVDVVIAGVRMITRDVDVLVEIVNDVGQRAERRPRERDERAPGNPGTPSASAKRFSADVASNRHPSLAAFFIDGARIPRR